MSTESLSGLNPGEMGKLLSEIVDADGDAGTIMCLIGAFTTRVRVEERERCAQVCLTIETELLAAAESHLAARRYDDYELLKSEALVFAIVKDRIRALAVEPVGT
jgi:hypothetical protein